MWRVELDVYRPFMQCLAPRDTSNFFDTPVLGISAEDSAR
jgi:hypothetical protein